MNKKPLPPSVQNAEFENLFEAWKATQSNDLESTLSPVERVSEDLARRKLQGPTYKHKLRGLHNISDYFNPANILSQQNLAFPEVRNSAAAIAEGNLSKEEFFTLVMDEFFQVAHKQHVSGEFATESIKSSINNVWNIWAESKRVPPLPLLEEWLESGSFSHQSAYFPTKQKAKDFIKIVVASAGDYIYGDGKSPQYATITLTEFGVEFVQYEQALRNQIQFQQNSSLSEESMSRAMQSKGAPRMSNKQRSTKPVNRAFHHPRLSSASSMFLRDMEAVNTRPKQHVIFGTEKTMSGREWLGEVLAAPMDISHALSRSYTILEFELLTEQSLYKEESLSDPSWRQEIEAMLLKRPSREEANAWLVEMASTHIKEEFAETYKTYLLSDDGQYAWQFSEEVDADTILDLIDDWRENGKFTYDIPFTQNEDEAVSFADCFALTLTGYVYGTATPKYALQAYQEMNNAFLEHEETLRSNPIEIPKATSITNSLPVAVEKKQKQRVTVQDLEASREKLNQARSVSTAPVFAPFTPEKDALSLIQQIRSLSHSSSRFSTPAAELLHILEQAQDKLNANNPSEETFGHLLFSPQNICCLAVSFGIYESLGNKPDLFVRDKRGNSTRKFTPVMKKVSESMTEDSSRYMHGLLDTTPGTILLSGLMGDPGVIQPLIKDYMAFRKRQKPASGFARLQQVDEQLQGRPKLSELFLQQLAAEQGLQLSAISSPEQQVTPLQPLPDWMLDDLHAGLDTIAEDGYYRLQSKRYPQYFTIVRPETTSDVFQERLEDLEAQCAMEQVFDEKISRMRTKLGFSITQNDGIYQVSHAQFKLESNISGTAEERFQQLQELMSEYEAKIKPSSIIIVRDQNRPFVPSALLEHEKTILVLDTNIFIDLAAPRNGGKGTWLDLLSLTAKLPNVTLLIPSFVADWELRGLRPVSYANGHAQLKPIDGIHHGQYYHDPNIEHFNHFLQNCTRLRYTADGGIETVVSKDPNIQIWDGEGDRSFFHIIGQKAVSHQVRDTFGQDWGEQAIDSMVAELPFDSHVISISSDRGYLGNRKTPRGFPVSRAGIGAYINAEYTMRGEDLQDLLGCRAHLSAVVNDINEHNARMGRPPANPKASHYIPGESGTNLIPNPVPRLEEVIRFGLERNATAKHDPANAYEASWRERTKPKADAEAQRSI